MQILITGGAGFIGSCLQAALAARGHRTIVADWLGSGDKWRNLARHPPERIVPPDRLEHFLAQPGLADRIEAVFHLGAISETVARDGDLTWQTNVELSARLWEWCAATGRRFIYASSAATYGAASAAEPFSDDPALLGRLRPLNLYGATKHAFDLWAMASLQRGEPAPSQWAGLKFFNVYGPNELHKGSMVSVVKVKYDEVAASLAPRLFRSDRAGLADGAQARDFIWVGDVVDVMLWLLDNPAVSGLFNCGTGVARTYLDLARAVCTAAGREPEVAFIDMPEGLRGQYQSFTQADMSRLRAAGYDRQFTSLEAGVARYVQDHLMQGEPHL